MRPPTLGRVPVTKATILPATAHVEYQPGRPCCRYCGVPIDPTLGCRVSTCQGGLA